MPRPPRSHHGSSAALVATNACARVRACIRVRARARGTCICVRALARDYVRSVCVRMCVRVLGQVYVFNEGVSQASRGRERAVGSSEGKFEREREDGGD
jgi:hypothetical protein